MQKQIMLTRNNVEKNIYCWPAKKPKAILILVHGASEYVQRYDAFANYLANNNISVYGYNHLGHREYKFENHKGIHFGKENGAKILVDDLEDFAYRVYQENPDLPLFVMGHSMGSLIVRNLLIKTRLNFDGAIICGSVNPTMSTIKGGQTLVKFFTGVFGKEAYSKKLNNMVFSTPNKTLSYNSENVDKYQKDEYAGMMFSNKALLDLFELSVNAVKPVNVEKMLQTNYFIISGADDPFSKKTKDLEPFINLLKNNHKVDYRFYEKMKHEIINEDNREVVYQDILGFIDKSISEK